ncbi:hypothetical protein TNCV_1694881 [Trichonephila clavipes]|nr:hypothetical protein TNCV_1694881 [Trichonephila clavipes]
MAPSLPDRNALIVEKIANVLEKDLKQHILKVDGTSCVLDPENREKMNQWKIYFKKELTGTVVTLDERLINLIKDIRYREAAADGTVAVRDEAIKFPTLLEDLFASTLVEQASKISASMVSMYSKSPMVEKIIPGQLSLEDSRIKLNFDIQLWKEFYSKKIQVFLIEMEEHLKKILSGASFGNAEELSREKKRVDLILKSKRPFSKTTMVEMEPNDIVENFWKRFTDKYFSGKASSANTEPSTWLNQDSESEAIHFIYRYAEWKYTVDDFLTKDIQHFVSEFVKSTTVGNEDGETFSSSALISIEHFEELRRKIVEESSRPEKEIEYEVGEIIELADSNEERANVKVLREEALESCKSLMRCQREAMLEFIKKQKKSVLTKGFTCDNLRKYKSHVKV